MNLFKHVKFWGGFFLAAVQLFGQSVVVQGESVKTQISFVAVAGASEAKGLFVLSGPKRSPLPVTIGSGDKSPYVYYEGPTALVLQSPVKDNSSAVSVARVVLPKASHVLILLAPAGSQAANSPPQYSALAISDDSKSFPSGSLRCLNFSGKQLQIRILNLRKEFGKGVSDPFIIATPGKPAERLQVELYSAEGSEPFKAYESALRLQPYQRLNMLIFPKARADTPGVTVSFLRDEAPAQPAARK